MPFADLIFSLILAGNIATHNFLVQDGFPNSLLCAAETIWRIYLAPAGPSATAVAGGDCSGDQGRPWPGGRTLEVWDYVTGSATDSVLSIY